MLGAASERGLCGGLGEIGFWERSGEGRGDGFGEIGGFLWSVGVGEILGDYLGFLIKIGWIFWYWIICRCYSNIYVIYLSFENCFEIIISKNLSVFLYFVYTFSKPFQDYSQRFIFSKLPFLPVFLFEKCYFPHKRNVYHICDEFVFQAIYQYPHFETMVLTERRSHRTKLCFYF